MPNIRRRNPNMEGEKLMNELTTDEQKKGAKLVMKALAHKKRMNRRKLTSILSNPENGIYNRSRDAKKLVKKLEKSETYPVKGEGAFLKRTDITNYPKPGVKA